jgi:hypothetical protein
MPRKKKAAQAAPLIQQIKKAQQQMAQQMAQQIKQQAKAQQVVQQLVQKAKQQSVKAPASTTASAKKRAKAGGVTDAMRDRASAIVKAISEDRLPVKQGVTKPAEAQGKTPRARHEKFLMIYKGAKIAAPKKGAKSKTVRAVYQQIKGQQKLPYFLSAGYTARVGGGASGPGVIRVIPKSGALPFRRLDEGDQRAVVQFLNTDGGKTLRGKGAKRQVTFQKIKQAIKTVRTGPGVSKPKQTKQKKSA